MPDKKCRVAFVDIGGPVGGSHMNMFDLLAHLPSYDTEHTIESYFVAPRQSDSYKQVDALALPTQLVPIMEVSFPGWHRISWICLLWWRAFRFIRTHQIDVVYTPNHALLLWILPCVLSRCLLVWNVVALWPSGLKAAIRKALYLTKVRHILYNSQACKTALGIKSKRISEYMILNFVTHDFLDATKEAVSRPAHTPFRIGWAGRMDDPIKNAPEAIAIFADVIASGHAAELHFFGPATESVQRNLLSALPESAAKHVVFHGSLTPKDIYPQIDLLLLTSLAEGSGRVVIEAAAFTLPTVASAVGGIVELIDPPLNGITYDQPAQAVAAIRTLIEDNEARNVMGQEARKRALTHHHPSHIIPQFIAFFHSLVKAKA